MSNVNKAYKLARDAEYNIGYSRLHSVSRPAIFREELIYILQDRLKEWTADERAEILQALSHITGIKINVIVSSHYGAICACSVCPGHDVVDQFTEKYHDKCECNIRDKFIYKENIGSEIYIKKDIHEQKRP